MSSIRLTGLASGIDTESMITKLMEAEKTRVDKVEQDKQKVQWKQELYNSLNKDFANFILNTKKEFGLTSTSYTGVLSNNSISSLSWVKKATSSNDFVTSVSSTAKALEGSYSVNVERLADGVKAASAESISKSDDKTTLATQFSIAAGSEIKFTINGKEIIANSDDTMSDIVKNINSSGAGVQAAYDSSIDRFFIQTSSTGEDAELNISADVGSIGESFINDLKLNVTSYDNSTDPVTQENGLLTIGDTYTGVNALIDFAGATGIEQSSNQFVINGIEFDLNSVGSTTVTVGTDVDAVYDKISSFVEKYNEIVDKASELIGEKQYRDYAPLTDEQKEEMTEEQIELWEEKAKSGLLRNDSIISGTMQNIRSSLYETVDGVSDEAYNALYKIGITTEKWSAGTAGGRLEINEDELRKAITENVDGVLELLFKESEKNEEGETTGGGIITRTYDLMIDGMKEVINKAGTGDEANLYRNISSTMLIDFVTEYGSISTLDKDVSDLNERISDLNDYLIDLEDRYYDKFSYMEQFVQQMNSQSAWLSQQFGGM